jgi:hypothetical protein
MTMGKGQGIDKLASLMGGAPPPGAPPPETYSEEEAEEQEAALLADTEALLTLVAAKCGGNIFDMQVLVETAASMIREQIRDNIEEADDE